MPKKSKKTKTPVAPATPTPVAPATTPVTQKTTAKTEVVVPTLGDQFTALLSQLTALRGQLTSVTTQVRQLSKRADREIRAAQKAGAKRKRAKGNRSPSGFVKPTLISKELAAFLGKKYGTEMARTEVTREINGYIRLHKLQDPKNGRHIIPDTKLRTLLKIKKDEELTYFNLQRFMSPHFAKMKPKVPVVATN